MQTMQQRRAEYALRKIEETVEEAKENKKLILKEFKSYALGFPAMIRMNGLGQAAAFYLSKGAGEKGNVAYLSLYTLLSSWMTEAGKPYKNHKNLITGITTGDMHLYRLAQAEALLLLDWVKKFAKTYMEEDKK